MIQVCAYNTNFSSSSSPDYHPHCIWLKASIPVGHLTAQIHELKTSTSSDHFYISDTWNLPGINFSLWKQNSFEILEEVNLIARLFEQFPDISPLLLQYLATKYNNLTTTQLVDKTYTYLTSFYVGEFNSLVDFCKHSYSQAININVSDFFKPFINYSTLSENLSFAVFSLTSPNKTQYVFFNLEELEILLKTNSNIASKALKELELIIPSDHPSYPLFNSLLQLL